MSVSMKKRIAYISELLDRIAIPRNQIAAISGLTNTYIRDLEQGNIINVSREKIIAFAVALNHNLEETDELLKHFDRTGLSREDIPRYLKTPKQRKISSALHPLKDLFIYELLILTVEQSPGPLTIVSDQPSESLKAHGHRTYSGNMSGQTHPIYNELIERIGKERKSSLEYNLANYPIEHYICKSSLENYIMESSDAEEKKWRIKHLENLRHCVKNNHHFRLFLTKVPSSFVFSIKWALGAKKNDKLIFMSRAGYRPIGQRAGRLTGFVTKNPYIIHNFKEELDSVKEEILKDYRSREDIVEYLESLVASQQIVQGANRL